MEIGNLLFGNSRGKVPVSRKWQDTFIDFLLSAGFDSYGHIDNDLLEKYTVTIEGDAESLNPDYKEHVHVIDNGIFRVLPYWWGNSENIAKLPNFVYYPTQYELSWYKYPLRDSYANKEISYDEFLKILEDCKNSLYK